MQQTLPCVINSKSAAPGLLRRHPQPCSRKRHDSEAMTEALSRAARNRNHTHKQSRMPMKYVACAICVHCCMPLVFIFHEHADA